MTADISYGLLYFLDYGLTWFMLVPAFVFAMVAQILVKTRFAKYSRIPARSDLTGADAARLILESNGLSYVRVEQTSGELTDHYDPKENVIRLSYSTYSSKSIAAIGIAAHEAGHAIQHDTNYAPITVRNSIAPVVSVGSKLAFPLIFLGILIGFSGFITAGIVIYTGILVFQLITLPVEFNASGRAIDILDTNNILAQDELECVKKVLSACAMTYVAAAFSTAVSLLRLLLIRRRR